jgi:transposase-like protein
MAYSFEEEEMYISKILVQANLKCQKCGSRVSLEKNKGFSNFICIWRPFRTRRTVLFGTILENSKYGLKIILAVIKLWISGVDIRNISIILGVSNKTVRRVLTKTSEMIVSKFYSLFEKIEGDGTIVEVDEYKFGLRKYHRGRRVEGVWVLDAVERTIQRRIFLIPVINRKSTTLLPIFKKYVCNGSTIFTDCWKGYSDLDLKYASHGTVNHSKEFINSITGVHTNTIEGNWSSIKKQIPNRFRTESIVSLYLIRYMIKRNSLSNPFEEILKYLFYFLFCFAFYFQKPNFRG